MDFFCNIRNVFTVNFDASLLNKSINLKKEKENSYWPKIGELMSLTECVCVCV